LGREAAFDKIPGPVAQDTAAPGIDRRVNQLPVLAVAQDPAGFRVNNFKYLFIRIRMISRRHAMTGRAFRPRHPGLGKPIGAQDLYFTDPQAGHEFSQSKLKRRFNPGRTQDNFLDKSQVTALSFRFPKDMIDIPRGSQKHGRADLPQGLDIAFGSIHLSPAGA